MVNDILDDTLTYQDFKKHIFIQKLGHALNDFAANGDTFLNFYKGFCDSEIFNYKCTGYSFVGNNSKDYMDLIIDVTEGIVQDIYECSEFKNINRGLEKNRGIRIDKSY